MFKKIITVFIVVACVVAVGFIFVINKKQKPPAPQTSGLPMKVATQYWPGHYWIDIAAKKGWFKEAGLNVELVDVGGNFVPSVQDFVDGKMDVNHPVFYDLIKHNVRGSDLVVVVLSDTSIGGDAIASKKDIATIGDLRGKRVGVELDSFCEFLLDQVLEKARLTRDDITLVHLSNAEDIKPFIKGEVDATVSWEPFISQAIKEGDGRKVFDTSEFPDLISDVIAFHQSFIDERPGDVQAFVNVWYRTTQYIKGNSKEAFSIIADIYNVTPSEVQAFTNLDKIMDLRDNLTAFRYSSGFESLHGATRKINKFLIEKGMTEEQLDSTEFLDARFIRNLKK